MGHWTDPAGSPFLHMGQDSLKSHVLWILPLPCRLLFQCLKFSPLLLWQVWIPRVCSIKSTLLLALSFSKIVTQKKHTTYLFFYFLLSTQPSYSSSTQANNPSSDVHPHAVVQKHPLKSSWAVSIEIHECWVLDTMKKNPTMLFDLQLQVFLNFGHAGQGLLRVGDPKMQMATRPPSPVLNESLFKLRCSVISSLGITWILLKRLRACHLKSY